MMYGIISRFTALPGKRDQLMAALTLDASGMEGCHSFVVAHDPTDPDTMWLTEVRESKDHWRALVDQRGASASLNVTIPLVKDWGTTVETEAVKVLPG